MHVARGRARDPPPNEPRRSSPGTRPLQQRHRMAELPRGGDQEVRRRRSRAARGADRLLRVRLAVPAAARARDGAGLRARRRPEDAGKRPALHARPVPDHRRPAAAQRALAHRQPGRAGDRRRRSRCSAAWASSAPPRTRSSSVWHIPRKHRARASCTWRLRGLGLLAVLGVAADRLDCRRRAT